MEHRQGNGFFFLISWKQILIVVDLLCLQTDPGLKVCVFFSSLLNGVLTLMTHVNETKYRFFPFLCRPSNKAKNVFVCTSYDDWKQKHRLDFILNSFSASLEMDVGDDESAGGPTTKIYYKFIVDDEWCISEVDKTETDSSGNVNNVMDVHLGECCTRDGEESVVFVRESDGESAYTSISYPEEQEGGNGAMLASEVGAVGNCNGVRNGEEPEDLTSSVQITLGDSSSVCGSIHSRCTGTSTSLGAGSASANHAAGNAGIVGSTGHPSLHNGPNPGAYLGSVPLSVNNNGNSIMTRFRNMFHSNL